jgi:hypothetical protein
MHETGLNPAMIRVVVIVLFLIITQVLRARKKSQPSKPTLGEGTGRASSLEMLREAMRQVSDQARTRQGESPVDGEPLQLSQELQQPPTIEPESSLIPSFLLVALLACLCLMAYRYWAG